MQFAETKFNQKSLHLALKRYSHAVSDMEQTVLLPTLLRDVPADDAWDCVDNSDEDSCGDLYDNYVMLKAIRNTVESGLIPLDDHKVNSNNHGNKGLEHLVDADPEALFRFHLKGLFTVMNDLTKKSQGLTEKYMDIIGI